MKRLIILSHRYLGIVFGLLIVMWFASGIVMMYAGGLPRLTPELRLDRLPLLALDRVKLTPAEAADRAPSDISSDISWAGASAPARVQLLTALDRPAYRVGTSTVFADTGDVMQPLDSSAGLTVAATFLQVTTERVHYERTLTDVDQWTLVQSRALPLHKYRVDDTVGTEVYVEAATGEVTMLTTRRSRMLAWVGVIPHWMYFTALRGNQPLWYRIVVWTSAGACVLSVLGLMLSLLQFRRVRPFTLARAIPYSGLMRWHYITGTVFGLFTLTWAFSGLLSMEPFAWTNATGLTTPRNALSGGPMDLAAFAMPTPDTWPRLLDGHGIKQIDFVRMQGEDFYVVQQAGERDTHRRQERLHQPYYITGRDEQARVIVNARTMAIKSEPFSTESVVARLQAAHPDVRVAEASLLSDYDSYYYSRGRQTPLPVVRVKFADPAETWVYVDPEMSQVLSEIPRLARVERWLYNGLHSLDFAFWYNKRPLWDIAMLTLLIGGLLTTCLGMVMGIRRIRRNAKRLIVPASHTQPSAVRPQPQPSITMLDTSSNR